MRRLVRRQPGQNVTRETYPDVEGAELARPGKRLIEPAPMEQYFTVVFRHARGPSTGASTRSASVS